jgi:hypothetical protein
MTCAVWASVCLVLLGSAGERADQTPVPVDKLVEVFQTNEVRAEKLYVDKEFQVAGRVLRVVSARYGHPDQGDEDRYVVELQTKPLDVSRIAVQFYFDRDERGSLADLKTGQEVVIRGKCGNLVVYTGDYRNGGKDYTEIQFRKCKVVGPK